MAHLSTRKLLALLAVFVLISCAVIKAAEKTGPPKDETGDDDSSPPEVIKADHVGDETTDVSSGKPKSDEAGSKVDAADGSKIETDDEAEGPIVPPNHQFCQAKQDKEVEYLAKLVKWNVFTGVFDRTASAVFAGLIANAAGLNTAALSSAFYSTSRGASENLAKFPSGLLPAIVSALSYLFYTWSTPVNYMMRFGYMCADKIGLTSALTAGYYAIDRFEGIHLRGMFAFSFAVFLVAAIYLVCTIVGSVLRPYMDNIPIGYVLVYVGKNLSRPNPQILLSCILLTLTASLVHKYVLGKEWY